MPRDFLEGVRAHLTYDLHAMSIVYLSIQSHDSPLPAAAVTFMSSIIFSEHDLSRFYDIVMMVVMTSIDLCHCVFPLTSNCDTSQCTITTVSDAG